MVHRLHNRNNGYSENTTKPTVITSQPLLNATEGATALNIHNDIKENEVFTNQKQSDEASLENVSIENATYLQSMENTTTSHEKLKLEDEMPNFEVDSIELATPELFSDDLENKSLNQGNKNQKDPKIFENLNQNITIVEWPELIKNKPINRIDLFFEYTRNMTERTLTIKTSGRLKISEF